MNPQKRRYFDEQVEWVLRRLPEKVLRLLDEVPLCVEDHPSKTLMRRMGVEDPDDLCGCFHGRAIDERDALNAVTPDQIMIFRRGIYGMAYDEEGRPSRKELRNQIRITIVHELGHYHGMDEDEVREWGYG